MHPVPLNSTKILRGLEAAPGTGHKAHVPVVAFGLGSPRRDQGLAQTLILRRSPRRKPRPRTLGLKLSLGGEEELTGQSLVVGSKELRSGRKWRPGTHLIVTVHELQPTAGLLLLHVAQGTLQAEDHVLVLLYHLWEGHT